MKNILVRPSQNFDARPEGTAIDMIVLHYTNMQTAEISLERLCDAGGKKAKVSAHYLIDEDGHVFALVEEQHCAWHAGVAYWDGETNINGCSIGIELANIGPQADGSMPAFPEPQMNALLDLLNDIQTRHTIPAHRFLGHSDIAPARKIDPGELFDWSRLAEAGFGIISTEQGGDMPALQMGMKVPEVLELQKSFATFGYGLPQTGIYDDATKEVVTAFQRHYRRRCVDGVADAQSCARLLDLLWQKA